MRMVGNMHAINTTEEAVEMLQQLGLKEYEARCFVGLSRLPDGTAKQLSEITEVPRTRVYDAIRVLESKGLVGIHYSNPQRYRTVPIDEAIATLRDQYEHRIEVLYNALEQLEEVDTSDSSPDQMVWALTGRTSIEHRTEQLIEDATNEIVLMIGDERILTNSLVNALNNIGNEITLSIGTLTVDVRDRVEREIQNATTFISGVEWLQADAINTNRYTIGRLLFVDRSTFMLSSITPETGEEQAILATGLGNGLAVIAERLIVGGLLTPQVPGTFDQ